jgi:hypothetical protein
LIKRVTFFHVQIMVTPSHIIPTGRRMGAQRREKGGDGLDGEKSLSVAPPHGCTMRATTADIGRGTLALVIFWFGLIWFANHGFGSKILKPKPKPWKRVWFGLVLI